MNPLDTRQQEWTQLTASCGHPIYIRVEQDPVVAADMIAVFMSRPCGRSTCPTSQVVQRLPRTSINDVGARG